MLRFIKTKEENRLRFFTYLVYSICILFVILLFVGIFWNIIENKGNVKESYIFNRRPTIVITGSMEPVIQVNSIVLLEPVEFEDLEVGDIIRYTAYQGYSVMHRVISKNSSYVTTKGDANERPDTFVVTPAQITGRVVEIHNEYVPLLTFLFGKFEYDNMGGSILRACAGFIMIGIFISVCVIMFMLIFEMITTTFFFVKYRESLVNSSSYWLEKVPDREKQNEVIEKYIVEYKKCNIFKKIILAYKLRKYYNGLCNVEKEVLKIDKRRKSLEKWVNK